MTVTRKQRLTHMRSVEEQGEITPDMSDVVHTFADGWTINRLLTCGDVRREGTLMSSCLPKYVGDTLISDKPPVYAPTQMIDEMNIVDEDGAPIDWLHTIKSDLTGRHVGLTLYSLRDPANLPHATFWARPGMHMTGLFGYRNGYKDKDGKQVHIKPAYAERIREWGTLVGIKELDKLALRVLDARHSPQGVELNERYERLLARVAGTPNWRDPASSCPASRRRMLRLFEQRQLAPDTGMMHLVYQHLHMAQEASGLIAELAMVGVEIELARADDPEKAEIELAQTQEIMQSFMDGRVEDLELVERGMRALESVFARQNARSPHRLRGKDKRGVNGRWGRRQRSAISLGLPSY